MRAAIALALVLAGCGGAPFTAALDSTAADSAPDAEQPEGSSGGRGDGGPDAGGDPEGSTAESGLEAAAEAETGPEPGLEAGPEASPAPEASSDACTAPPQTWTCIAVAVSGPGSYCVVDGGNPSVITTPGACTACGQYTCNCVVAQASIFNPCGTHSITCTEAMGGPSIVCN